MIADFFVNNSDSKKVNKSLSLIKASILLQNQPINIEQPILIVSYDSELLSANYCYIDTFDRYYYIDNIESREQRLIITCSNVDVLMSFRAYLNQLNCVVKRQESKYNKYLIDDKQEVYSYSRIQTIPFNAGFGGEALILAIAGGSD